MRLETEGLTVEECRRYVLISSLLTEEPLEEFNIIY